MKYFRDIKLPVQNTQKIEGTDIEMLDFLWDMKIAEMNEFLLKVHVEDIPSMMVFTQAALGFVGLYFYKPPDIWLNFDNQKYQIYIAPNLPLLIHYWVDQRMRTHNLFENQILTKVIQYLENYLNKLQNQSVSHTG